MKTSRPLPASFQLFTLAIWAAVSLRWIVVFVEHSHPYLWLLSAILVVYGVMVLTQPFITKGPDYKGHLYFGVQSALIVGAMLLYYEIDFFGLLFVPLTGQVLFRLPRRAAFTWIGIFGVSIVVGQLIQFGRLEGLSFSLLYLSGLLLVAYFANLMLSANDARAESEQLLGQLQDAHRQLQEYAGQAEELATAKERNRLARELHDSVAQTLYGLTLQAEAASRKLTAGQTDEVAEYLREIRDSSKQTLKETRLLIFELRQPILEKEGLASALRARFESVESRSGLRVQVNLQDVGRLSGGIESGMYGISNEVLNNILKHAHATEIKVSLEKQAGKITLGISDNGVGFDPASAEFRGGLGLKGIRERAEQFGGALQIQSGENGTTVTVEAKYE